MQTNSEKCLSAPDLERYTTESEETMDLFKEFKERLRLSECKFNMKSGKYEDQYARATTVEEKPGGESPVVERSRPLSTLVFGASAPPVSGFDTPPFPSNKTIGCQKFSQAPISHSFTLPQREIIYFDGNPKKYWLFMRSFDSAIGKRDMDDECRLSYLIHYCKGEAKEAIESCSILDPSEGDQGALEILRRRFGQAHVIARAHLDSLVDGPINKTMDSMVLMKLAGEMRNCQNTLSQLNRVADLNASRTLSEIVRRLPQAL
nr:unnamed protein product [Fasciola hepatica]